MTDTTTGYYILIFYGLLTLFTAYMGNYFYKKDGFSNGYVFGTILSLGLWFGGGREYAHM